MSYIIKYLVVYIYKTMGPISIWRLYFQLQESHYEDKMTVRFSYLYYGKSYTWKMAYLYWNIPCRLGSGFWWFLPKASFGLRVLSSPACVCVSVCVCESVCQSLACLCNNSGPVQARITKFGSKMQNTLVKVPIVLGGNWPSPSRSNLT